MKRKRKPIPNPVRLEIASRQHFKCTMCYKLLNENFQIDHKIPWSVTNNDNKNNLQALCANCHADKTSTDNKKIKLWKIETGKIELFTCDCNEGYTWEGKSNYSKHLRSNKHLVYENKKLKQENEKLINQLIRWKDVFYVTNPHTDKTPV